jgi:hypothetical protein
MTIYSSFIYNSSIEKKHIFQLGENFFLFFYSHVHTLFRSFLPPAPLPHPVFPSPLSSRQVLFCLYHYKPNKEDKAFLLVELRIAIQKYS